MHHDDPTARRQSGERAADDDSPADRAEAEQDLRATAESIRQDVDELAAIEEEKTTLDPSDPQVDVASDESVRLANRLARETRAERQLSHELD
jgi:hypothetical protein